MRAIGDFRNRIFILEERVMQLEMKMDLYEAEKASFKDGLGKTSIYICVQ